MTFGLQCIEPEGEMERGRDWESLAGVPPQLSPPQTISKQAKLVCTEPNLSFSLQNGNIIPHTEKGLG